ncbi:hypothetical protein FRUB_03659 [Fimbriiglobus ruber]|uniref:Uncharacterized protein n=1 Tax=Fimbriiglobus ruber TaxID=1908690 RepID=A0A225DJE0_9BACT|nr:hypothetical protein FRUB_03659 [Fimbriiglobus ruber]
MMSNARVTFRESHVRLTPTRAAEVAVRGGKKAIPRQAGRRYCS